MPWNISNPIGTIYAPTVVGATATGSGGYQTVDDEDLIQVSVAQGGTLEFYMDGQNADPRIFLYDHQGYYLAYDNDSAPTVGGNGFDSLLNYTVTPGTYYILTDTDDGAAGGTWQLTITMTAITSVGDSSSAAGTDAADTWTGSAANVTYYGYDGTDLIAGGSGNEVLYGNLENDTISGGAGVDHIYLGQNGGEPTTHPDVDMTRQREGIEFAFGGDGDDVIYGNFGGDFLQGDAGSDVLYGGQDNDTLVGGAGNDSLYGNRDADLLSGGAGADRFFWDPSTGGQDSIADFSYTDNDILRIKSGNDYYVTFADDGDIIVAASDTDSTVRLIGVTDFSQLYYHISTF